MAPLISRAEKNFFRLLCRCENLTSNHDHDDWRLEQYIKDLDLKLQELKKLSACQPSKDTLAEYAKRVEFLKGVIETEKLPTASEKALANQLLMPGSPTSSTNKLHQQTKARYFLEMRQELLGSNEETTGMRLRQGKDSVQQEDFDAVLRYHNSMQEKAAEEMLSLVYSLKQNSVLTSHVIRKDTEVLDKATSLADSRHSALKKESERLETFTKRSFNWCVWVMLGIICMLFMWMIVFIRLFPKR